MRHAQQHHSNGGCGADDGNLTYVVIVLLVYCQLAYTHRGDLIYIYLEISLIGSSLLVSRY